MKTLTLELGSHRSWREYSGGRWEAIRDAQGRIQRTMTPSRHEITVDDATAVGLQVHSDEWAAEHAKLHEGKPLPGKEPRGVEHRMLRVSDVQDAGPDGPAALPPISHLAREIVNGFAQTLRDMRSAKA